jgi:hypothetical protein
MNVTRDFISRHSLTPATVSQPENPIVDQPKQVDYRWLADIIHPNKPPDPVLLQISAFGPSGKDTRNQSVHVHQA